MSDPGVTNFTLLEVQKVKMTGITAVSTADATSTASTQTVDPTEFAAVVTLLNALKAKLNEVISG